VRVARRFGWRGLAVVAIVAAFIGPPRDYWYMATFPEWGAYAPTWHLSPTIVWPRNRRVPRVAAWEMVPNLAVEIVRPTNTGDQIVTKIREYFQAGVERVWVIYPAEEQV
jgi:Uma2 family endonuclease